MVHWNRLSNKETASKEALTETLVTALAELDAAETEQHRRAIIYLASLVYHRRSPEEREALASTQLTAVSSQQSAVSKERVRS